MRSIFREGNKVADSLANYGWSLTGLVWLDSIPPFARSHGARDSLGLPNYRFCYFFGFKLLFLLVSL